MSQPGAQPREVATHYERAGLVDRLATALDAQFRDGRCEPDELAGLDQFHLGGIGATAALAKASGVRSDTRVLDAGSGLGGPARWLASHVGCHVTAVDLTPAYCGAARLLNQRTGTDGLVDVVCADVQELSFAAGSFDLVWSQHAAMNIVDKAGLYRELRRVLAPGGRLALFDVVAGHGPVVFPVPWAPGPEISFLSAPPELRQTIERAGFSVLAWTDMTAQIARTLAELRLRQPAGPGGGLGLGLVVDDLELKARNLQRNVQEGRIGVLQAVLAVSAA